MKIAGEREVLFGTGTQGGGRFAPLPWATVLRPFGAENLAYAQESLTASLVS